MIAGNSRLNNGFCPFSRKNFINSLNEINSIIKNAPQPYKVLRGILIQLKFSSACPEEIENNTYNEKPK